MFVKASAQIYPLQPPKHGAKSPNESQSPPSPRHSANTCIVIQQSTHNICSLTHTHTHTHTLMPKHTCNHTQKQTSSCKHINKHMHTDAATSAQSLKLTQVLQMYLYTHSQMRITARTLSVCVTHPNTHPLDVRLSLDHLMSHTGIFIIELGVFHLVFSLLVCRRAITQA